MADEILQRLLAMKKPELVAMANEFTPPVELKKSWNTKQIAFAIRKRQKQDEKKQQPVAQTSQQPNKDFEQALNVPPIEEPPTDGRGGVREGAGRPKGLTAEKAKVKNLPQQPNQTIKQALEMVFSVWSESQKVPELTLSEDEANSLALPVTQLQEYYFPNQVPEIAWTWCAAIVTLYAVMDTRIRIIQAVREKRKAVKNTEVTKTDAKES